MKLSELEVLIKAAKNLGVTEIKRSNGRDGVKSYTNISATLVPDIADSKASPSIILLFT